MRARAGLFRRIVYASDFSRASGKAFTTAVEMARTNRAPLTVVHVMTPMVPVAGEGYVLPETYEQIERSARKAAEKQLDRLVAPGASPPHCRGAVPPPGAATALTALRRAAFRPRGRGIGLATSCVGTRHHREDYACE